MWTNSGIYPRQYTWKARVREGLARDRLHRAQKTACRRQKEAFFFVDRTPKAKKMKKKCPRHFLNKSSTPP